jgi:hypothetical protein
MNLVKMYSSLWTNNNSLDEGMEKRKTITKRQGIITEGTEYIYLPSVQRILKFILYNNIL